MLPNAAVIGLVLTFAGVGEVIGACVYCAMRTERCGVFCPVPAVLAHMLRLCEISRSSRLRSRVPRPACHPTHPATV